LILRLLVCFTLITMMVSSVNAQPYTILWTDDVHTNDIALSRDGQYVALVRPLADSGELRFYSRSSGTPLWTWSSEETLYSVAISEDGDCVAAGGEQHIYFWKNAKILTGNPDPTWSSIWLGRIDRKALDISNDGNYVAACGTGVNVFYWANAKGRSTGSEPTTWQVEISYVNVEAIDLSSDGDFVAAGSNLDAWGKARVLYWKNARTLTGAPPPTWMSTSPDDQIVDVAVSDDGDYVAAGGRLGPSPVYYWANAKSLSDDPPTTWESASGVDFSSIDMSSNGDSVIAGAIGTGRGVYFWSGARSLSGTPSTTWTYPTEGDVHDVAINSLGDYMAADLNIMVPGRVYFFDNMGNVLWDYEISLADKLSISGDGATLAVGTEVPYTGYLFDTGYSSHRPVGGFVISVNKLAVLTPYLALAGLVAALTTILVARSRRKTN